MSAHFGRFVAYYRVSTDKQGQSGLGRVDEERNLSRSWAQLVQQLNPLRQKLHIECGHAREIAARTVQADDEPEAEPDRVRS